MISVHNFLSADQIGINLVVVPSQNPVFYHKNIMAKAIRKLIDDARRSDYHELGLDSKGIGDVLEFPDIFKCSRLTRLIMSHNKITILPSNIIDLSNLESLNLFDNHLESVPSTISGLLKLKHLNLGMNKLSELPRGFGSFPMLEVLDLTYNNLTAASLPSNFFLLSQLRALYLGDNEFTVLPSEIGSLSGLQILVLRDNELEELPPEIGKLTRLKELHLQCNQLTYFPPELAGLPLYDTTKTVFKAEGNPLLSELQEKLKIGPKHVFEFLRTSGYALLVSHFKAAPDRPVVEKDKTLKKNRMRKR
jgi:Leucine-rich repeat (LRR) protein